MPGTATFAEMLEAELNCTQASRASGASNRPMTLPLFVFDEPQPVIPFDRVDLRSTVSPFNPPRCHTAAHAHSPTPESRTMPVTEPTNTRRMTLSAREQRALTALNKLGAALGDSLSPRTLRRAFRQLARRYHPDRHPGCSPAEQERLARTFAEAAEHCRVLTAAFARHARPH